jgi:RND family efflux transporter MFP subunit
MSMKKRWIVGGVVVLLGAAAAVFASRGKDKPAGDKDKTPFRVGAVKAEDLQVSVREVGVIDPFTKVDVKSVVSGRIQALRMREGAVVRVGDVLAEVEPDVTQAQELSDVRAAVVQAEVSLKDAERLLAAQRQLHDSGLIGSEALKDFLTKRDLAAELLKAAKMRYQIVEDHGIPISGRSGSQLARVTSPMNGVVIKRGVELGDMVQSGVSSFNAGTVLFTVADLKTLIVRVNLNEVDIAKVTVGQPVRITLDAYPQKTFSGTVRFVAPAATLVEKIKVFAVEIELDQLAEAYRTGMSANVEILGEKRPQAISIPLEALQRREGKTVAYRLKKGIDPKQLGAAREGLSGRTKFTWLSEHWNEYFDAVPVEAGIATLERVEVVAGLSSGDEVSLEDPTRKRVEKDDDNN